MILRLLALLIALSLGVLLVPATTLESAPESTLQLADYQLVSSRVITEVTRDLSGATWSANSNTLFVITNRPTIVLELDLSGALIRRIELVNFHDTEGIVHLGGTLYAIVQERRALVTLVEIGPDTRSIDAEHSTSIKIDQANTNNRGLEGIAWSASSGLFVANEMEPVRVLHFAVTLEDLLAGNIGQPRMLADVPLIDVAGLHVVESDQRLLALSQESLELLELDFDGKVLSGFNFAKDRFALRRAIRHPEGVTMDDAGRIYVVGEPNHFLVLEKPSSH